MKRANSQEILDHIRSYFEAASEARPRSVEDILEVARQGCLAFRWLGSSSRNITCLEEEVTQITRDLRDAEARERTLRSVFTVKTEEAAEKSTEVGKALAFRDYYTAQLRVVRREGKDAVATVRAEMQTAVEAHAAKSSNLLQTAVRLSNKEEVLRDLRLEHSTVRSTHSKLVSTRDALRDEVNNLTAAPTAARAQPRNFVDLRMAHAEK